MNNSIVCPYCKGVRLQVIGSKLIHIWKGCRSEVEYQCLDNESHIFKTVKINKING